MAESSIPLTQERLKQLLDYDPLTGLFVWLPSSVGNPHKGKAAGGSLVNAGYVFIRVDGVDYRASRLAWLYMTGRWPNPQCDHRDLDRANNRWENLREATRSQNGANRKKLKSNKSGFKGVSLFRQSNRWRADIVVNNKQFYLGLFDTKEEAHVAYCDAASRHFGEFARME